SRGTRRTARGGYASAANRSHGKPGPNRPAAIVTHHPALRRGPPSRCHSMRRDGCETVSDIEHGVALTREGPGKQWNAPRRKAGQGVGEDLRSDSDSSEIGAG